MQPLPATTTMANAYSIQNRVTIGKTIQGFYYYGPMEAKMLYSPTSVAMGPPTVFEIINVLESDHHRTSLAPPERTQVDYIYRLIVRCGSSICRMTYVQKHGARPLTKFIPHTSIREVMRRDKSKTGVFHKQDIVCVTVPFEYPSTESGSRTNIVLERGTLLQITGPACTQKGGKHTKSDPDKAFYSIVNAEGEANYDVYWKASVNVTHSEILGIVSSN